MSDGLQLTLRQVYGIPNKNKTTEITDTVIFPTTVAAEVWSGVLLLSVCLLQRNGSSG